MELFVNTDGCKMHVELKLTGQFLQLILQVLEEYDPGRRLGGSFIINRFVA